LNEAISAKAILKQRKQFSKVRTIAEIDRAQRSPGGASTIAVGPAPNRRAQDPRPEEENAQRHASPSGAHPAASTAPVGGVRKHSHMRTYEAIQSV
jgi:hypothetical protein